MFAVLPSNVIGGGLGYGASNPSLAGQVSSTSPSWGFRQQHEPTTDIRQRVTIYRDSLDTPWGFRLQGGKDFNTPLSVKRVFSGSPAVGQLTRDDLILEIDDEPVDGLLHADVLEKIKSAGNSIVLTIQTTALEADFGYASQDPFQPLHGTIQQQQLYSPKATTLQYESHQTPTVSRFDTSPTTYETSPTTYETSPTTYDASTTAHEIQSSSHETSDPINRTAADVYNPKVTTHQSRHRSARKFQFAATVPSGLSEPGWVPRPKSVPRNLPLSTPQPPLPSSQYRSPPAPATADHKSVQYPSYKDFWKSESTSAQGSGVPAWYGSLRSTRAPHSWELRAAKVQIPLEQESADSWKESEPTQHVQIHEAHKQQSQPQQVQSEPSRTFKAEIRGLQLARPAFLQAQSTPEWEDASEERIYTSLDYTHSAPETPVADAAVHEVKNLTSYQDIQTGPSAIYTQQTAESPSVKLQPSLLFGERSGRGTQQPLAQSRVVIRAQPVATKTTITSMHARKEVPVSVSKGVAQIVSPPTIVPVRQAVAACQANPQAQPVIQLKAQEAVANLVTPSIIKVSAQPADITYLTEIVERFNPGPEPKPSASAKHFKPVPEKLTKLSHTPVERFNPGPEQLTQTQVKHVSVPQTLGKLSKMPVERFNPGPEQLTQTQVKHVSVPQTLGKLSKMPVERFNPGPERPEHLKQAQVKHISVPQTFAESSKMPVERFNPGPDRLQHLTQTKHISVPQTLGESSKMLVERFNPGPDRLQHLTQTQVKPISVSQTFGEPSKMPVERFNPGPDRTNKLSQTEVRHVNLESAKLTKTPVERFNPGPDRLTKA